MGQWVEYRQSKHKDRNVLPRIRQNPDVMVCAYNPSTRKMEKDPPCLLARKPTMTWELQAKERPCSKNTVGAGERGQWFRTQGALLKNPGSFPNTSWVVHNHL